MEKTNCFTDPAVRKKLARTLAEESAVLLKNEGVLPLAEETVSLYGLAAYHPNLGGMGSGGSFMGREIPSLTEAFRNAGIVPEETLDTFYQEYFAAVPAKDPFEDIKKFMASGADLVASGAIYEFFGRYSPQEREVEVPEEILLSSRAHADTAVYVFGRSTGGEECDRHIVDDYDLLKEEKTLIGQICKSYETVVLLINTNGLTDLSWIDSYPSIKAVLFIGAGGEEGPQAVANLLLGNAVPSGKLAFTIAPSYQSYPTADTFSFDKDRPETIRTYEDYGLCAEDNGSVGFEKSPVTFYQECLYIGYRYFDTFDKEVLWPFGFGLSYADFFLGLKQVSLTDDPALSLTLSLTNTSSAYSGKETVQVYASLPEGKLEQPYQKLIGFKKSSLLSPGQSEDLTICIALKELASYDEESASWILEEGDYKVRVGTDSRNTRLACILHVPEEVTLETVTNCLSLHTANKDKLSFLSHAGVTPIHNTHEEDDLKTVTVLTLDPSLIHTASTNKEEELYRKDLVERMSDEELMAMCVGYGPGLPFAGLSGLKAPNTIQDENGNDITTNSHPTGHNGYISPAIEKYGIYSCFYKDGPASCGKIAWPTGMTLSCAFNEELWYNFGSSCAQEAQEQQVDSWLAPALNLHRNPLCGRDFEYFSEDPLLTGTIGRAICDGASKTTDVTCCPKHFVLNEQETYRRGSTRFNYDAVDSIVNERTARELYLKPFEMTIKGADVRTIMTSFNKINGTFAAGRKDLCTTILRNEWGFKGVVVTDWGDMDIVVDGADGVAAGNDVIMPGGPVVIEQIRKGYQEGRVTRKQLETAVSHLLWFVDHSYSAKQH